jgi:hypothetical protein
MPDQIYELQLPDGRILEFTDVATMKAAAAKFGVKKEQPLTREHGPHGGENNMREHPHAQFGRLVTNNLPAIGGMLGGLAAAPLTGGMSAVPALAIAAGMAGLGGAAGAAGREGLYQAQGLDAPGDVLPTMGQEALIQGGSQALGGAFSKGVGTVAKKAGEGLYGLALRPEMETLASKFPGITRQALAKEGIEQAAGISARGAGRAGAAVSGSEAAVDAAIAALPKGTTLPMKPVLAAAKPVIKEAQSRAAGNASVKPVFKHVRNAAASHGDQIKPQEMLALQRATSRQAGSAAGVMPPGARPALNNMEPGLIQEANRAMAGAAQSGLEAAAPAIAPIQAKLPVQHALAQAIQDASQRPLLSQYMMTGATLPIGAAVLGGGAGAFASGGDPTIGLTSALSAAALANPRTLSNLAILGGRGGGAMASGLGQGPANTIRGLAGMAAGMSGETPVQTEQAPPAPGSQLDMASVLWPTPSPTPLDMTTGMRLIPKEDYWTPR